MNQYRVIVCEQIYKTATVEAASSKEAAEMADANRDLMSWGHIDNEFNVISVGLIIARTNRGGNQ